jgi:polyisoprenoid-binding protein YceI
MAAVTQPEGQVGPRAIWRLDPVHSAVWFVGKQLGISTIRGQFTKFQGNVLLDEEHPEQAEVHAQIETASLQSGFEPRDAQLKSSDFLDVQRFPEIVFRSTRIEQVDGSQYLLHGDLTVKEQTRPVTLDLEFHGIVSSAPGQRQAAFGASTTIDRREWGMTWNMPAGVDRVLVSDRVRLEIDATLNEQKPVQEKR